MIDYLAVQQNAVKDDCIINVTSPKLGSQFEKPSEAAYTRPLDKKVTVTGASNFTLRQDIEFESEPTTSRLPHSTLRDIHVKGKKKRSNRQRREYKPELKETETAKRGNRA